MKERGMVKILRYFAVFNLLMFLAGCAIPHYQPPLPYDANNPLKRVAVLPMKNDSNDVDGPAMVRQKMVEALENRSYVVQDTKETDQILRDRMGITLGGQLSLTNARKIAETLGVDGLLYGTLVVFDETTLGAIDVKKVGGKFKLVNAMTGQAMWERKLGVRSEMSMAGKAGAAARVVSKAVDARDKEVPWVTIESTSTGSDNLGKSFAISLGKRLFSSAAGTHLEHESTELANRVTGNLPWGPGTATAAEAPAPPIAMPEIKMPEPPSFGYMDWEGRKNFSAILHVTTLDKNRGERFTMAIPIAVAGNKMRMEMDLSRMFPGASQSTLSRMVIINRGDRKTGYTLYPNVRRYLVHTIEEQARTKPRVEKVHIGRELVAGHPTDKFRVSIAYQDGRHEEGLIWNARDLDGMTIRSEVENKDDRVTAELEKIVLRTPPAHLFEIPAGFTEAQGFMDLMR
jgi:hypothetical protein